MIKPNRTDLKFDFLMEKVFENEKVIKFEVVLGLKNEEILIVATDKEVQIIELQESHDLVKMTIDTNPMVQVSSSKEKECQRLFKTNREI